MSSSNQLGTIHIYNNLVWDNHIGIKHEETAGQTMHVYNNTLYGNNRGFWIKRGGITIVRNNISFANHLDDIFEGDITMSNNIIGNSTDPDFISTDPNSADHLKIDADSPAVNAGYPVDIVSTDYFNTPRSMMDIGAHEHMENSPPQTPKGIEIIKISP